MTKRANPAVSAAQYGMAQAVLSGASTGMPVSVARELVDKTSPAMRRKFAKELASNPSKVGELTKLLTGAHVMGDNAMAGLAAYHAAAACINATRKRGVGAQFTAIRQALNSYRVVVSLADDDRIRIYRPDTGQEMFLGGTRKSNPESDAASMYESFHGTPSTGELVIQDQIHYHGNLAELGVLRGLKVRVVTGEDFTLEFGGMPGQGQGENPRSIKVHPSSKGVEVRAKAQKIADKTGEPVSLLQPFSIPMPKRPGRFRKGWTTYDTVYPQNWRGWSTNPKRKSKRGPLTTAYSTAQGIVPGLLGIGDGVIRGVTGNPKPISQMTAGEINKALNRIDAQGSQITAAFIAAGRGDERPSEYLSKTDALSQKALANYQARMALRNEMERRYGPGTPSRLPKGFGPIKQNRRGNPGSDSGPVILCSNETGNQLYFRGGDQSLDLDSLNLADAARDHMVIGEVWALAYSTKKDFDEFAEIEYVHTLGLEKYHVKLPAKADLWEDAQPPKDDAFSCGNLPTLMYDSMNKSLSIAGGIYKIEKPWAETSPGIEN